MLPVPTTGNTGLMAPALEGNQKPTRGIKPDSRNTPPIILTIRVVYDSGLAMSSTPTTTAHTALKINHAFLFISHIYWRCKYTEFPRNAPTQTWKTHGKRLRAVLSDHFCIPKRQPPEHGTCIGKGDSHPTRHPAPDSPLHHGPITRHRGTNGAVRCTGHRSALHRASQRGASAHAPCCVSPGSTAPLAFRTATPHRMPLSPSSAAAPPHRRRSCPSRKQGYGKNPGECLASCNWAPPGTVHI